MKLTHQEEQTMIDLPTIAEQRLENERLAQPVFKQPVEVVRWFGAVQAQEYALAKWALSLRMTDINGAPLTDAAFEKAFNEGQILRTHVMRPTWHFVTPEDIRWLLELTAPRVHTVNGHMYRQSGLDEALLRRSSEIIAKALEGGNQLTKVELGAVLAEHGIVHSGVILGYIIHFAELERVVCSGARRGRQFTYALLDERAPQAKSLPREEALAELTRRFYTSHGPATVHDFAWWSGLTIADVKAGVEMNRPQLEALEFNGKTWWYAVDAVQSTSHPRIDEPGAWLLPPYDEYTIAYKDHSPILDPEYHETAVEAIFNGVMMIDGMLIGNWRRSFPDKKKVLLEYAPFRDLTEVEQSAFASAAERFASFVELKPELIYVNPDDMIRWRKPEKKAEPTNE
jgi:hypothetical protein